MNIVILICCVLIIILLILLLLRVSKPTRNTQELDELKKQLNYIKDNADNQHKTVMDQINRQNTGISTAIVQNMTLLSQNLRDEQKAQQEVTAATLNELKTGFTEIRRDILSSLINVRQANTEALDKLRRDNQESLDKINGTVNEKLQKTLDDKISKSFETVNKRLAEVYEGLGEMKNVASGVSDLKNVLSNVKTRGIMGEIQLGAILEEILAPEQYEEQCKLQPNTTERVDFAVKLPGKENGEYVYLPIDSKFPGDTYSSLVDAYESGNSDEIKARRASLESVIKSCAKSIHDKYIVPPYTTDFAIMFLPFEGLYSEVVNMGMVEVLQREYKVNIAGPSTMAAMLNSLRMGFRTLAIQQKSGEVWKILEAVKKEFTTFETVLNNARNRLRQADEDLDKLIGTRTRAINRKLRDVAETESLEQSETMLEIEKN
jgi:DNA recombination protein RmuC